MACESQLHSQTRYDHLIVLEHRFHGAETSIMELRNSVSGIHVLLKEISARLPEKLVSEAGGDQSTHRLNHTGGGEGYCQYVHGHDFTGTGEYRQGNDYHDYSNHKVYMPRVDLPVFDGNKAASWLEHCKLYFEVNQTPENYKSRLASLSFTGDAEEWYDCYWVEHPNPTWPVLVEAVFEIFKLRNNINLVIQFKRVKQKGSVDEYVREFQRAKARLLAETSIKHEYFFVWSFVCGLKEDIQNYIHLFKPQTLNDAFNIAVEIETAFGPTDKKLIFLRTQPTYIPKVHIPVPYKIPITKPQKGK